MNGASMFFEENIAMTQDESKEDKWDLKMQNGLEEAEMPHLRMWGMTLDSAKLIEI